MIFELRPTSSLDLSVQGGRTFTADCYSQEHKAPCLPKSHLEICLSGRGGHEPLSPCPLPFVEISSGQLCPAPTLPWGMACGEHLGPDHAVSGSTLREAM